MARMTLEGLVDQMSAAYGGNLISIVLYGSAATERHDPKRSDYNILLIVRELGLGSLAGAAAAARAWSDAGNPPPLTFTESEWRRSADIFPMEYADILQRNRVLFGAPPFEGISVDPRHLRLQLEREVMGKLLRLRQGVLAAGRDGRALLDLVSASLSALMAIFRAVARLHGDVPSSDNLVLVRDVAAITGLDVTPFERAVRHVRGDESIPRSDGEGLMAGYVGGLERLVAYLDQHPSDPGATGGGNRT